MLKRISIILVLGILIFACDGINKPIKPDNLISKAQMTDLLYDLYLVNASKGVNRSTLEKNYFDPEFYILKKHNVDSTRFAESNNYYAYETETYKAIVDEVKERLESEKQHFEDIREIEADSIKQLRDSIAMVKKTTKDSIRKTFDKTALKKMKPNNP
ncbi:hypothetical protein ADIWIN_1710 [Winogradskyella psychrotolerans RS-3]|uniref:DUF4296 domain-containing protein n=1 Tax=Winogradskyella psychrotolerans RS-3 TaxID=641526 RepID=S7X2P1_9FLAO|nr:DUF4296 domain-containing protein [Winogradskyella psychrotolerans]EPR73279.1 hypothetical protein ADIWIN_1710 [Winogradskyella psychrotolerans RS-3]